MDLTATTLYLFCISIALAIVYDQCTKRILSRLRDADRPESAFGFVRVYKSSSHDEHATDEHARAHGIDIIFVHGLGSNPDTTWGPKKQNWINSFLLQDIPVEFHKDIRIFFYNYDSYWKKDAVRTRLRSLGESLLGDIDNSIRRTEDECTRSLVFVGHSYGGLVVKQALIQASTNVVEFTKAVFFLGTPHRGSSFSVFGRVVAWLLQPLGSNALLLQEIASNSNVLRDLYDDFENINSKTLQVVNFFEQRPTRLLKLWFIQWERFCVEEQSARYGKKNFGLSVDHFGLNKYTSKENENYKRILGELLKIITPIASERQHRLYSVPITIVKSYVERHLLSAEIEEKLLVHYQGSSVPHVLTIHGLGGTGKTQLARKYVEDHKDDYNPILLIDARDEKSVRASFERCAGALRLSVDRGATQISQLIDFPAVQAVLQWLRERKETDDKWLVVIDNANDNKEEVMTVIPKGNQGSIIITSQDKLVLKSMKGYGVEVGVMKRLEAKALLLRHLEIEVDIAPEDVLENCNKIARELGDLALAIDLAGAYIGNDTDPIQALQRYLADYGKHRDYLLKNNHFCKSSDRDKTVWTVWDTTLERIEQRHADMRPGLLLAFLAQFRGGVVQDELFRLASLNISTLAQKMYHRTAKFPEWLAQILESDKNGWDDFYYRRGCDVLVQYSLLQRTQGDWSGVSMHKLVQWRATNYEQGRPWNRWHLAVVEAACRRLAKDTANPQFRRHLVTHIPDVSRESAREVELDEERMLVVWSAFRKTYFDEGLWQDAEKLDIEVMETRKSKLGLDHPDTLTSMANLASTYWNQGRWGEAEKLEVEVMETRKNKLGLDHPDTLTSMANLASTYWNQGRWGEAEKLDVEVMEMSKNKLGLDHPDTLTSMANLALTYRDQGRWEEAEKLEVEVMETRKNKLGLDHPDTLTSMANLAATYWNQGRWEEAEKLEVEVMEMSKNKLGLHHPDTLNSMANLASTYRDQGRWEEAEKLDVEVMEMSKNKLGLHHPDTLNSMANLASTYWNQGRWGEAEKLQVEVMETRKNKLGLNHPNTLNSMANLAATYRNQDRWEEAEKLEVELMEISKNKL